MERVVFLDRDGTLNEEVHYLHRKEDLRILDGVPEAICRLRRGGYRIVVVTNQAGVARGYYQESDVKQLHCYMNELLRPQGAEVDFFFYCPHHPEHGLGRYKVCCHCRKPGTGMFEMAEQYIQVDKAHSWMVGDKLIDVEAGKNYGVRTVLVGTGYGRKVHEEQVKRLAQVPGDALPPERVTGKERKLPYDVYAETLIDAARAILEGEDDRW
ncbi:MAG: D-glycero-beta-D-manno-heptose 1,7-bisphosphate 7-phosphatase [Lachnospiraceae bacterium]|nr:D-glycero-beta-D-manno-heptose 1,7-bisphosphate 7-phosphatase [Lachnospiraceae bacterium]